MARSTSDPAAPQTKCPICSTKSAAAFHPFCSKRCADVDLLRWLNGSYAIPGGTTDEDDDRSEGFGASPPSNDRNN